MSPGGTFKNPVMLFYVSIIVLLTAVAFFPSLFNGFVYWDDPGYVTENDRIQAFSMQNMRKIFTEGHMGNYYPLTMVSYALEYHFFRSNPFAYHLTNYVLHLLVTISVFYFIYLISRKLSIAFIAAALFGVHPLHVESVAWIAERKDLLCAIFYMLALIAYVIYLKQRKKQYYWFCLLFTVLSLSSKAMAVTIPVILILLDYFLDRKMDRRAVFEKLPVFAIALMFGIINLHFQILYGSTKLVTDWGVKLYFFSKVIIFYLIKFFVPVNLSAMYPYHSVTPKHLLEVKYYIVILALLAFALIFSRKYSKKVIFGSCFFIITIAPVLKIVPGGDVFAADRYMYLPSIGILYILGVFINGVFSGKIAQISIIRFSMFFLLFTAIILSSVLTWKRCKVWKNTETLFKDVIRKYPNIPLPYNNIGTFYAEKGELDKAIEYFNMALAVNPDFYLAKENLEIAKREKEKRMKKGP